MPRNLYADSPRIHPTIPAKPKEPSKEEREAALMETVLENIGTPDDLQRVDVKELQSQKSYRVNVYRHTNDKIRISDSYYVTITPDGIMSSPAMNRKYFDDLLSVRDFQGCREACEA